MTAARDLGKTSARETARGRGGAATYRNVLAALPDDATRLETLRRYRAAGFTADDFATSRKARRAMAEALTRTEDRLEIEHPRRIAERDAIKAVRRRLELEVAE